ncbi:MAG TPA: SOS response-associated peptidase [Labilithrix sp.]|jgi:putative SOS response-associated peptidase YedK
MCGRATLVTAIDSIAEQLGVEPIPIGPPRYNLAPGQPVLVLKEDGLAMLDWGLKPFWSKKPLIQARAETVGSKLGESFASRRCLMIVDGFYEWSSAAASHGKRQPHHVHLPDGRVFCIAAVFEGTSCAVLTTEARGAIAGIHDRMPLVVSPADRRAWLSGSADDARAVLGHTPRADFELAPVSMRVNDVKNDDPSCLAAAGSDPGQIALPFR